MNQAKYTCMVYGDPEVTGQEKTCRQKKGAHCKFCGFEKHEYMRRLEIPLQTGPDGLQRKYVGIPLAWRSGNTGAETDAKLLAVRT